MRNIFAALSILTLAACGGGGGANTNSITPPSDPKAVVINSFVVQAHVDGTTDLSWAASNGTSCSISGSTTQTKQEVAGEITISPSITDTQSYTLTCVGAGASATATKTADAPNSFSNTCDQTNSPTTAFWIGDYVVHNDKGVTPLQPQCQSATVDSSGTIDVLTNWAYDSTMNLKAGPGFQYGKTEAFLNNGWGQSTVAGFPMKVTDISNNLGITYTNNVTNQSLDSAYDLLFDLYFTDNTSFSDEPLELSINSVCVNACGDTYTDTFTLNGVAYSVAYHPATNHSEAHLEFSSLATNVTSGSTNFKPFVDYAVAHGYLKTTQYLGTIFVVNEIYAGSATSDLSAKISSNSSN